MLSKIVAGITYKNLSRRNQTSATSTPMNTARIEEIKILHFQLVYLKEEN